MEPHEGNYPNNQTGTGCNHFLIKTGRNGTNRYITAGRSDIIKDADSLEWYR